MLENLKKEVTRIAKKADKIGLCQHKSGNFSIKDPETGYIAMSPSGVARENLTEKDICIVDMDANIIEIETDVRPTSEIFVHIQAYASRPDIQAVVHTHSHFATAFAVANKSIPTIVYEALTYGGEIEVAKYGRPGTKALADSIIDPLKSSDVCLMQNHGAFAVGDTLDSALLKAIYIEDVAQIYYRSLMINQMVEPEAIPQSEFDAWKYPLDM
jgi:L-fuculose-phosphate aldolase